MCVAPETKVGGRFDGDVFAQTVFVRTQSLWGQWSMPRGEVRLKLGLFGAELLKCAAAQIRTKSAKVGDGRPARSRAPGGPSTKRSSLLRPGKAAKAGARRASTKRSSLRQRAQSC